MSMERHFVPFPLTWDDAPIDISFLFEDEKPAGKHGFLQVQGERLVFEDGTRGLFYGTNFNSALCFPDHAFAETTVKRLVKFGINIVRFHQMDADWCVPNIFQFTRGKRLDNTRHLDPESMERFDYLVYLLKQNGIYMYLDNITYRRFRENDGVDQPESLSFCAKPYSIYDERMIELQKEFMSQLWNHVNQYTGVAYKDEPAIVMTEVVNENDFYCNPPRVPLYKEKLNGIYRKWMEEKGREIPDGFDACDNSAQSMEFRYDIQKKYYDEMREYLKSIGVRIPIAGTNYQTTNATMQTMTDCDFADGHYYLYEFGLWNEYAKGVDQHCMMAEKNNLLLLGQTIEGKPFFASEWDIPWPNEHRAESPVYLAAMSGLQGWHGFAIHTYHYLAKPELLKLVGKETTSGSIAGIPYREGLFNTFNDPAKFGLFYTAALMVRRGDVKEAKTVYALNATSDDALIGGVQRFPDASPLSDKAKVVLRVNGVKKITQNVVEPYDKMFDNEKDVTSETGQMYRNWRLGYGWVDTDNTKAAYGFVGRAGELKLDGMEIFSRTDYGTIALTTLSDKKISQSDNMLLTTVGRSENTDMKFLPDHSQLVDFGRAPALIEVIDAEIKISTEVTGLQVWAINAEGTLHGLIPSTYADGVLSFRVGVTTPSMYYLIQKA